MTNTVHLQANNLVVRYDGNRQNALSIEHFAISGGSIALLGPNGSGKSTFLKALLGVVRASSGAITASCGERGELLNPQADMAFCPEAGAVFLDVSVKEYLAFWGRLKLRDAKAYQSLENRVILDELGVSPLLKNLGKQLSKGQRRRVHAAVGFILKPRLFLFDEPFDGLDIQHAAALVACIERVKPATAFIISSHRIDIVERLCDMALVLRDGTIRASGSLKTVTEVLGGASLADGMMG